MIENSIFECLKMKGEFEQVYPFETPDSIDPKKTAITFMRIGTRINTRYYASETMKTELERSSFLCSITNPKYFSMIEEFSKLQGHIANYQDDEVLQMEVESYDDFKSNLGQVVREFTVTVLHQTQLT